MATSVARASSLWKRSPSPMTCFQAVGQEGGDDPAGHRVEADVVTPTGVGFVRHEGEIRKAGTVPSLRHPAHP
jgi:hypothetical protein